MLQLYWLTCAPRRKSSRKKGKASRGSDHIHGLRKLTRQNENIWRRTAGLEIHRQIFREHMNNLTDCITQAKIKY